MKDVVMILSDEETAAVCLAATEVAMNLMLGVISSNGKITEADFRLASGCIAFVAKANDAMNTGADNAPLSELLAKLEKQLVIGG